MTKLLLRLFTRGTEDSSPAARERVGRGASITGIAANLLLFALKIAVGTAFHSISVTADAVNNLTDSASSLVTLFGFRLAARPADPEHPYGHARMEYLAGMIVSFIVVFLGLELGVQSAERVFSPTATVLSGAAFAVLAVSILLKFWLSRFYKRAGEAIQSEALFAVSKDSRNDMLSTFSVLLGAALSRITDVTLDGWFGAAVALFIVISGVKLIQETADPLLGKAPDKALVGRIREKLLAAEGVLGMHDLEVHSYGAGRVFASVHCEVDAARSLLSVHESIDSIEREFMRELSIHLVIHPDPVVLDDPRTDALKAKVESLMRPLCPEAQTHDFHAVWKASRAKVTFDLAVPFSFPESDDALCRRAEEALDAVPEIAESIVQIDRVE